ncbi:nuclear transport factor 2 family protein [Spirillospora sp. NPDC048911]|uniref:nuclear transport factor 2 family protein n=1 Tax=Spirillospora sp. NPDC048911 TaxID=3364527 RepID=UPI003718C8F1
MNETTQAVRNKQLVERTYEEFVNGNIEYLRTVLKEDFIEHSPGNPSGRDAFIEFIAKSPVADARFDLKRVIADEQYAVVHYLMTPPGDERGVAVVDLWRVEDGLIAEHWDVQQPVPGPKDVPHGML